MRAVDIATRLRRCAGRWGLEVGDRLAGGFRSEVFACTRDGADVVLKLTVTPEEARSEAAALHAWRHTGAAVRLIDTDVECDALLLARIRPGTPLSRSDTVAVDLAADLLMWLHSVEPGPFEFPTLAALYPTLERQSRDDVAYERRTRGEPTRAAEGLARLDAARAAALRLCADAPRTVLLHGDFLLKNLLPNGTGFLAIDPIPRLGDPASDIGFFAADHAPERILDLAVGLADRMGEDPERARRWAAIWAVLQTTSAWREDQAGLDALLASGIIDPLLR